MLPQCVGVSTAIVTAYKAISNNHYLNASSEAGEVATLETNVYAVKKKYTSCMNG